MNVWKLTAANNLESMTEEAIPVPNKRKVRVTKILLEQGDSLFYKGIRRVEYPRVLGRIAVGIIADDEGEMLHKGERVLLHMNIPQEVEKQTYLESGIMTCGVSTDGFLRDFAYMDRNDLTPLPDAVNDEKALLIQHLALAKAAVEALSPKKGDHITVIGGDKLGLFICQLLIYQQVSPILIDTRADRLEFAKSCGVYYTALANDTLIDYITEITGGRLADGVICSTGAGTDEKLPFNVCAREKTIVYCGTEVDVSSLSLNDILNKQLTLHGVSDGTDYIENAINLIANKAIDVSPFRMTVFPPDKLKALFQDFANSPKRATNEMYVINLV